MFSRSRCEPNKAAGRDVHGRERSWARRRLERCVQRDAAGPPLPARWAVPFEKDSPKKTN